MKSAKKGPAHLLRLEKGEKIVETLTAYCLRQRIGAAFFQGLGTCRKAELGFFRTARQRYFVRTFRGDREIASLQGNVSLLEGKPFVHAHIVISGRDFLARGGHLVEAEVQATCEIVILPLRGTVRRRFEPGSGLSLWDLGSGRKLR